MASCTDVEFAVSDGTVLRGRHYRPAGDRRAPVVVMSHGFGVVLQMALPPVAEAFADAGLGVLLYDHRNLGASDGEPRQEVDPAAQLADARDALSVAQGLPGADPAQIGRCPPAVRRGPGRPTAWRTARVGTDRAGRDR